MKKTIISLLTITLFGCNNSSKTDSSSTTVDADTTNVATEISKLNSLIKKFEEPSQTFNVPSDKSSVVKGKAGTKIKVNPADLAAEDGQPLGKTIEVELKELTNSSQLLKSNAATMSDGKLLISGGAYYINMTSDGRQLKIKDNSSLDVEFPKLSDDEMSLFTGQRDSLGQMNWKSTSETLTKPKEEKKKASSVAITDTTSSEIGSLISYLKGDPSKDEKREMEINSKVYKAMKIKSFGWVNCDRFIEVINKTDIEIIVNAKDSITSANMYLVFNDINSVMQACYYSYKNNVFNTGFRNIPIGRTVRLIAYTVKNDKVLSYMADLKVKSKETINYFKSI
jgi:hypothetical protein